jgi:starch synthase
MLRVLSIQSDIIGNRTYSAILRECFASIGDIDLDSYWYNSARSLSTRVINRLASLSVPVLNAGGKNLDLRRARAEWSYGRTSRILTERLLRSRPYDLLHFHTQVQAYDAVELMTRIPTIITTDMTASLASRQKAARYPWTYRINIALDHRVFAAAEHIVVFTEWARQSVIHDYDIHEAKVSVIPPGARLDTFSPPRFDERRKPKLLFIGGNFEPKGGWDLLDVFTKHFSDVAELHIITSESIRVKHQNVHLHSGILPYTPQWHHLIRDGDVLVVPTYAEAYGLVFQEAGGYGLALIGGRVGGVPEVVIEGQTGFLVEPGNRQDLKSKIERLVYDPQRLSAMRRRSWEVARERFDAERNVKGLAECFRSVSATG